MSRIQCCQGQSPFPLEKGSDPMRFSMPDRDSSTHGVDRVDQGRHPPTAAHNAVPTDRRNLSKAGWVSKRGREPHGCGDRAYRDVLAASPACWPTPSTHRKPAFASDVAVDSASAGAGRSPADPLNPVRGGTSPRLPSPSRGHAGPGARPGTPTGACRRCSRTPRSHSCGCHHPASAARYRGSPSAGPGSAARPAALPGSRVHPVRDR